MHNVIIYKGGIKVVTKKQLFDNYICPYFACADFFQ